ncbi:MAG: hypothetical protein RIS29_1268 [Bacteroidota bacterium]|jgi:hypothetical protein
MKRIVYLSLLLACSTFSYSQNAQTTIEQLIADIFEQYTAETETSIDYDSFYEDLMQCAQNPINLNHCTKEELKRLQFLTDIQIENLQAYVYTVGQMQNIFELQLVEGLDMTDIRRMLPFVRVGEGLDEKHKLYLRDFLKYGRNDLLFRLDKGLETKEGYRVNEDGTGADDGNASGRYLGNELYNSLKYRYHFRDKLLLGFTAEKDAGEPFRGSAHKGYDFYSAYAQLNNTGRFKTIVLGDFRANFGQGLVLHPEFSMGKSSYVLNVTPRSSGLKKFSSTDESNFFRGAGVTYTFQKFEMTAFVSTKKLDADTTGGTFPTIIRTGYHRTQDELDRKHRVGETVIGGNISYTNMYVQLGFTAVHTSLTDSLNPDREVYNHFYFRGKQQTSAGINYRMRLKKLNIFGETAMMGNGALATLNGCYFSPASQVNLVVVQRYYSPEYDSFYASSFGENSRVSNESGIYLGAEVRPFRRWRMAAYADSYRFPWPKYGVDAPSLGNDYLFQADFTPKRNLAMFWRLRYKMYQNNLSGSEATMPVIIPHKKASLRYQLSYTSGNFSFKNVLEGNLVDKSGTNNWTYGIIAAQDVSYSFEKIPLQIDFRYQFFDATDYENRFYSYEKDVLYAFSIPMYYGQGSRCYLNLQYDLTKKITLWFKIAQTIYADDRESLSSGNEAISGNRKTDVRFLLRWKF